MIGIEELSARVAEAEQRFGLIGEEHAKYSARLVSLLDTVESRLREHEAEVKRQADANATLQDERDEARRENEQLRDMLLSLLRAVEDGGRGHVMQTMQTLETRVSGLVDASPSNQETAATDGGAEIQTPPASDGDGPDAEPPDGTEAEAPATVEPPVEAEEVALDDVDAPLSTMSEGQEGLPEEAPELGEPAVSLADIMQRVSDLAGADDDPEAANLTDLATSFEPDGESAAGEGADDSAEAQAQAQAAVATGS